MPQHENASAGETAARPAADPVAAFFAAFANWPPPTATDAQLQDLLERFAAAAFGEAATPGDLQRLSTSADRLRADVEAHLAPKWLAFFEYHAAWAACQGGALDGIRRAADRLAALELRQPPIEDYHTERMVLHIDLLRALGDLPTAVATCQHLLATTPDSVPAALRSGLYGSYSDLLRDNGQIEAAAEALQRSLDLAQASGDDPARREALLRALEFALATGRFERSVTTITAQLAAKDLDPELRSILLVCLGHAESGLAGADPANLQKALATLDTARPLCAGHLQLRTDLKRLDLALRLGSVERATQVVADCAESLGGEALQTLGSDACEFIGGCTRLLLLRSAPLADLQAGWRRQHAALEQLASQWREQPPQHGGIGFLHQSQRRELVGAGIALELALAVAEGRTDGPVRAAQLLLDLQACTSLARARATPPTDVARVQQALLREQHAALIYLPTRSVTFAVCLEREGVQVHTLAGDLSGDPTLRQLVARLARSPRLAGKERDDLIEQLQHDCDMARERLLPAALGERILGLQRLTVVGTDLLGGVPMEALRLPDGRLLGEALAVDSTASLPFATALASAARPIARATARVAVLGCTSPGNVPPDLGIESFDFPAESLSPGLGNYAEPSLLVDTAVGRDELLGTAAIDRDILHIVAHRVRRSSGLDSGFLFRDGTLWREDLIDRPTHGLVVVSTCGGGEGPARSGEGDGLSSLAGIFLWNGAQAVISSRTELQVLDHLATMARCHLGLAAGLSPAEAMRRARSELAPGTDLLARLQRVLVQVSGAGHMPILTP